jgi:hypothetical protein
MSVQLMRFYISIYGSTALLLGLSRFFSILILYTVSRTPLMGDQPIARPPPIHRTNKQNKCIQTSMPQAGLEPTTPVLTWAKTVHALDCPATVIGINEIQTFLSQAYQGSNVYCRLVYTVEQSMWVDIRCLATRGVEEVLMLSWVIVMSELLELLELDLAF